MKLQKISTQVSPFSGINFLNEEYNKSGFTQLVDNQLGIRCKPYGFSYSDIIKNLMNVFFCGGDCAEDIQTHLRNTLLSIPDNNVPSADTILRGIKELSTENTTYESDNNKKYEFNINRNLNDLNIKSLLLTKQLTKGGYYDFDYDNQIIPTEKYDTKKTYKKINGYFPGVATIGNKIVYIENRDGNSNVKFEQASTLTRAYELLAENDIKIFRSRMDAGSYSKKIIDIVSEHSKLFYIRANKSSDMYRQICNINSWKEVEINHKIYEVASITFDQFFSERNYRLVVMREKSNSPQIDMFTGDTFVYRSILTNDWQSSEKEIIEYYNQRGTVEKVFDVMNNDFGWSRLPCSFMNENTAYMIIMALANNFYNYYVEKISRTFENIKPTTRLKRFIFRFISIAGKWVYSGRQWVLKIFTNQPYELIR